MGVGLSQATTGLVSRSKGADKPSHGRYYIAQLLVAVLSLGLATAILGNMAARPFMQFLGANEVQTELGLAYIRWLYVAAALFMAVQVAAGILTAHGNTRTYRNVLVTSSVLNLLLDPMLAFGWFGLPALGMLGIAIATVISMLMMLVWMGAVIIKLPMVKTLRAKHFSPRRRGLYEITAQALPMTFSMFAINIGFVINTYFLASIENLAVAAYGIALRIEQLILLLSIGLYTALLSIAGQNFGARQYDRMYETLVQANRFGLMLAFAGSLIMLAGGTFLVGLFNKEEIIIKYGYQYLVVGAMLGPVYIIKHHFSCMLQAIGRPAMIAVFGVARLVALPLVFCSLFVLVLEWGAPGIWASLFLSNFLVTIVAAWYSLRMLRKHAPMPDHRWL